MTMSRWMRVRSLMGLVPVLVAGCAACASVRDPAPLPQAEAPAPGEPAQGKVEVRFVPDPARIAPALRDDQDFLPPSPIVTHLPKYPAGHERAGGPVIVTLRFVVGETGAVRDVRDSPLGDSAPAAGEEAASGTADPAFRAAAIDAVEGWLFVPAAIRTIQPGADLDHDSQPDYTVLVDSERVPVYLDVRFTFEVVAGKGHVRID